jgi:GxxExxY protein
MNDLKMIMGHAKHVMKVLGKGYRENDYCNALQTSFGKAMIPYRREVMCPTFFMDEIIGFGRADFVLDGTIIEVKANKLKITSASDQLNKYIKSLERAEKRKFNGIIINFNQTTGKVDIYEQKIKVSTVKIVSKYFKRKT